MEDVESMVWVPSLVVGRGSLLLLDNKWLMALGKAVGLLYVSQLE